MAGKKKIAVRRVRVPVLSVGNKKTKTKTNTNTSTTRGGLSRPASNHKKQTSLLSFWGKPNLVGTKRKETKPDSPQLSINEITRQPAVLVAEPSSPQTTPDQETDAILVDTEESEYNENDARDVGKTEQICDGENNNNNNNNNRTNNQAVSSEEIATKNSRHPTLESDPAPSIAVTPCKADHETKSNIILCRGDESDSREERTTTTTTTTTTIAITTDSATDRGEEEKDVVRTDSVSSPPVARNQGGDEPGSPSSQVRADADADADADAHDLSEYEKLRLRNIERNNARLAALGLLASAPSSNTNSASSRRRPPRKKHAVHKATRQQPLRRSSRNRNANSNANANTESRARALPAENESDPGLDLESVDVRKAELLEVIQLEEEQYTVSPLLQYEMNRRENHENGESDPGSKSNTVMASTKLIEPDTLADGETETATFSSNTACLAVTGPRFLPPKGLNAIYSLEFWTDQSGCGGASADGCARRRSNWLVGAGKAGMIALWDTSKKAALGTTTTTVEGETFVNPVLSWKAHSGRWIADAKFLPGPNAAMETTPPSATLAPSRLVTAGNDGTVCLWDLSTVSSSTGAPRLLFRTGKEYHSSGIFCMDAVSSRVNNPSGSSDVMICTGSKDKSIVVSSLDSMSTGDATTQAVWRSRFHTAKVGAVKLQSPNSTLLASASDDGIVALHDVRTSGTEASPPVATLEDAHDRPHSVLWDPYNEFVLVTAGLDPIVKVWDRRNLSAPVACLEGHVPTSTGRIRKIHRPAFFDPDSKPKPTKNATSTASLSPQASCPFLLTGGQGSSFLSMYQQQQQQFSASSPQPHTSLFSRGKLPTDCGGSGSIAVNGKQVAVAIDQGEIILLEPTTREQRIES
eukprot:jgi/Psemu1/295884/fgenesh1_pm.101_\